MKKKQTEFQLGKRGISEEFIETIRDTFKTHESVRISVLKSAGHERNKLKEFSKEILEKLGKNYSSRVIGFTITLRKWRKPIR